MEVASYVLEFLFNLTKAVATKRQPSTFLWLQIEWRSYIVSFEELTPSSLFI